MIDYEKLGLFYLGRQYDPEPRQGSPELFLLESKHLVTHGLVVGMTGSGKTGLGIALLEEAALDGIPAIVIDPKGDLGNLMLTFPELRGEDFAPWIPEADAQRQGLTPEECGTQQATLWKEGLARWHQDGERIRRLRASAEFALYTPGSTVGRPLSILTSFAAPGPEVLEDGDLLRERVSTTVTGLLGLVGIDSDPVRSREAILLSALLQTAWSQGQSLDLAALIQQVQSPPMPRIGVLELEAFFPAQARFELVLQLNNLLASPGFAAWTEGAPLDPGRLLYSENGRPRVAICCLAHLGERERMFFVTLLLSQILAWMRSQSGTGSLRALVYMDEIAGYFPPVANPPSKPPLLTLLKQARAYGVGVVLATQNPVDLDYKGLANIGTWFVGRLQTERDKARVLEGLEGAATGQGLAFDRSGADRLLAGLGKRVFLVHSVHEEGFELLETRWTLSYLRGPLSRTQVRSLTQAAPAPTPSRAASAPPAAPAVPAPQPDAPAGARPVLPPEIPQFFAPARRPLPPGASLRYESRLLGLAQVRYSDAKLGLDTSRDVAVTAEITDKAVPVDWTCVEEVPLTADDLAKEGDPAQFGPCAGAAAQPRNYARWSRDFVAWIQEHRRLALWRSAALGLVSKPGEPERDFRIRLQQAAREARDAATEKLREAYAPKMAALQDRLRRAEAAGAREAQQATRAKVDTLLSFGSTLLGAFLGRKAVSASTVGRAASTLRSAGRAMEQAGDVGRAQENAEGIRGQLQELEDRFAREVEALQPGLDPGQDRLEPLEIRATRPNIRVQLVALLWVPVAVGSAEESPLI